MLQDLFDVSPVRLRLTNGRGLQQGIGHDCGSQHRYQSLTAAQENFPSDDLVFRNEVLMLVFDGRILQVTKLEFEGFADPVDLDLSLSRLSGSSEYTFQVAWFGEMRLRHHIDFLVGAGLVAYDRFRIGRSSFRSPHFLSSWEISVTFKDES